MPATVGGDWVGCRSAIRDYVSNYAFDRAGGGDSGTVFDDTVCYTVRDAGVEGSVCVSVDWSDVFVTSLWPLWSATDFNCGEDDFISSTWSHDGIATFVNCCVDVVEWECWSDWSYCFHYVVSVGSVVVYLVWVTRVAYSPML